MMIRTISFSYVISVKAFDGRRVVLLDELVADQV